MCVCRREGAPPLSKAWEPLTRILDFPEGLNVAFPPSRFRNGPKNSLSRRDWGEAPPLLGVWWGGSRGSRRQRRPRPPAAGGRRVSVPRVPQVGSRWPGGPAPSRPEPELPRGVGVGEPGSGGSIPGRRGGEDSGNSLGPGRWSKSGGGAGAEERSRSLATSAHCLGSGDPQVSRAAWENYARNSARAGAACSPGDASLGRSSLNSGASDAQRGPAGSSASGRAAPCVRRPPHPRCLAHSAPRYLGAGEKE